MFDFNFIKVVSNCFFFNNSTNLQTLKFCFPPCYFETMSLVLYFLQASHTMSRFILLSFRTSSFATIAT